MGFDAVGTLLGAVPIAPPKDNLVYSMTNAEASFLGQVLKFSSGKLTKAATTDATAAAVALEAVAAATPGNTVRVAWITPGTVFKATATGTAHGSFAVGLFARLDADGKNIDRTDASNDGPFFVMRIDATNNVVYGVFRKAALWT